MAPVTYETPGTACRLFDPPVTPDTIRRLERQGILPVAATTANGERLFRREDVLFVAARRRARMAARARVGSGE
jgi:DNA-binding transcriptional MerR regulator